MYPRFCPHYHSKRRYGDNGKENQNMVIGANDLRRATESLNKGFSKAKLSGQTSLGKGGPSFSKSNNIVYNITSFIPLVQERQPAGIITGKRDVKVKALRLLRVQSGLLKSKRELRMKEGLILIHYDFFYHLLTVTS